MQEDHNTSSARSGKTAQLVHTLLTHIKQHPGQRLQVETASQLTMERLARVLFFTAGFPTYDLAVKDISLEDQGFILFENGSKVHFSLAVEDRTDKMIEEYQEDLSYLKEKESHSS